MSQFFHHHHLHLFWISIFSGYKPNSALQASLDVDLWTPKMFLIISSCSFSIEVLSQFLNVLLVPKFHSRTVEFV